MQGPRNTSADRLLTADWLIRLRWAEAGLLSLLALLGLMGWGVDRSQPVAVAASLGLAGCALLHWARRRHGRLTDWQIGAALGLDTLVLTVVLAVTGGDANPFALLYLVLAISAAMSLPPRLAGLVFVGTALCYGGLFVFAPADLQHHDPVAMRGHLLGMYGAYLVAGLTMVLGFIGVRARQLQADRRLSDAREIEQRNRRLASLATLAAGAAHELATPLSTILVVSHDLKRRASSPRDQRDLSLVEEQVERCQGLLSDLACDVGLASAEGTEPARLGAVLLALAEPRAAGDPAVIVDAADTLVDLPVRIFEQVMRRLLDNARDASPPDQPVRVSAWPEGGTLHIEVSDQGAGMSAELARRVGEPFFTTKPDGRGLGLYFVRSVVEQIGGALRIDSRPGQGTTVRLDWPVTHN